MTAKKKTRYPSVTRAERAMLLRSDLERLIMAQTTEKRSSAAYNLLREVARELIRVLEEPRR